MRKTLVHDPETNEMRLRFSDLWEGKHECTEYRIIREDGTTIKNRPELDGKPVEKDPFGKLYVNLGLNGWSPNPSYFEVEQTPVVAEKVECRRMSSKSGRAKCGLCS